MKVFSFISDIHKCWNCSDFADHVLVMYSISPYLSPFIWIPWILSEIHNNIFRPCLTLHKCFACWFWFPLVWCIKLFCIILLCAKHLKAIPWHKFAPRCANTFCLNQSVLFGRDACYMLECTAWIQRYCFTIFSPPFVHVQAQRWCKRKPTVGFLTSNGAKWEITLKR